MKITNGWKNDLLDRTLRFFQDEQSGTRYKNDHATLNPYNSLWPSWDNSYYSYNGSFTTPDCDKDVQWILMKKPIDITMEQREAYRSLISAVPNNGLGSVTAVPFGVKEPWNLDLKVNNRGTQVIDGRTVLEFPNPAFTPREPTTADYPRRYNDFKPSSDLKMKSISESVSLSFVGCAAATLSVSLLFGFLLGRARRNFNSNSMENELEQELE